MLLHQGDEDDDEGAESELEESESEAEVGAEAEKPRVQKEEKKDARSSASHNYADTPVTAPAGPKGHQKGQVRSAEEVSVRYIFFNNLKTHHQHHTLEYIFTSFF